MRKVLMGFALTTAVLEVASLAHRATMQSALIEMRSVGGFGLMRKRLKLAAQ